MRTYSETYNPGLPFGLSMLCTGDCMLSANQNGETINNPGNIWNDPNVKFAGEIETDEHFKHFETLTYGYRALLLNLQAYINKRGLNTIEKIIYTWCPPGQCNTENYIKHMEERTGIPRNKIISSADLNSLAKLAAAIHISENGTLPKWQNINEAVALLGGYPAPVAAPTWWGRNKQWAIPVGLGIIIIGGAKAYNNYSKRR